MLGKETVVLCVRVEAACADPENERVGVSGASMMWERLFACVCWLVDFSPEASTVVQTQCDS